MKHSLWTEVPDSLLGRRIRVSYSIDDLPNSSWGKILIYRRIEDKSLLSEQGVPKLVGRLVGDLLGYIFLLTPCQCFGDQQDIFEAENMILFTG